MTDMPIALKARYVLPISGPAIDGGIVVIQAGTILSVGRETLDAPVHDLGDVALMPGLVNAHTHLEFSDLAEPLGTPGSNLPDWIREVIGHRRGEAAGGTSAILAGISESLAAGCTTLGEIATSDWRIAPGLPELRPTIAMFYELIGPTSARAKTATQAAHAFLEESHSPPNILPGLSPHASYTVHARLLSSLIELSQQKRIPLAMHLAESREEIELLNLGSGAFREMLEAVGAWDSAEDARLSCTLDYLTELARGHRALVIHGNYLDVEEIAFLADHANRMAVVYCPRTHAFFEQEPYPLAEMLNAGVTMALGTDSRASNPDLSILEEVKFAAELHPTVSPARLLDLATTGGARALGLEDQIGAIAVGKRADLVAVTIPGKADPFESIIEPTARIAGVWLAGKKII